MKIHRPIDWKVQGEKTYKVAGELSVLLDNFGRNHLDFEARYWVQERPPQILLIVGFTGDGRYTQMIDSTGSYARTLPESTARSFGGLLGQFISDNHLMVSYSSNAGRFEYRMWPVPTYVDEMKGE